MLQRILNKINRIKHIYFLKSNARHLKDTQRLYLSFGENCLTDNIIARYQLKTFTTPFSHGRSNVEYILNLELDNYKDFLSDKYLCYENLEGKSVPRLKRYNNIQNTYNSLHMNGFEFTHHDVKGNEELKSKFESRVSKLKSGLGKNKYLILYHHRICESTDLNLLLKHLNELKTLYAQNNEVEVILFKQVLIPVGKEKGLKYHKINGINVFDFHTHEIWGGDNPNLLWAYNDDVLIKKMIKKIKTI